MHSFHDRRTLLTRAYLVLCALMCGAPVYAAPTGVFAPATKGMLGVFSAMVSFVSVLIGVGAIVSLASLVINLMKGDQNAARRLVWWVGGLVVGFVLLRTLSVVINS